MATPPNLLFRASTTPTVPVTVSSKGSALTNDEIDGNFKSISNYVATAADNAAAAAVAMAIALG
jgi:hypothetical protein